MLTWLAKLNMPDGLNFASLYPLLGALLSTNDGEWNVIGMEDLGWITGQ
jgi:hypothetical protein